MALFVTEHRVHSAMSVSLPGCIGHLLAYAGPAVVANASGNEFPVRAAARMEMTAYAGRSRVDHGHWSRSWQTVGRRVLEQPVSGELILRQVVDAM